MTVPTRHANSGRRSVAVAGRADTSSRLQLARAVTDDDFGNAPGAVQQFLDAAKELEEHGLVSPPIFDGGGVMIVGLSIPEKYR